MFNENAGCPNVKTWTPDQAWIYKLKSPNGVWNGKSKRQSSVTIQMNATEQCYPVVLSIVFLQD